MTVMNVFIKQKRKLNLPKTLTPVELQAMKPRVEFVWYQIECEVLDSIPP